VKRAQSMTSENEFSDRCADKIFLSVSASELSYIVHCVSHVCGQREEHHTVCEISGSHGSEYDV
jgi:hypothetical protein